MKELYIAPELELLCLAPAERIAEETIGAEVDFGELFAAGTGGVLSSPDEDVEVDLDGWP